MTDCQWRTNYFTHHHTAAPPFPVSAAMYSSLLVVKGVLACNTFNLKLYLQKQPALNICHILEPEAFSVFSSSYCSLNGHRCIKICHDWLCCCLLLLCLQIHPPLRAQPTYVSPTWRWVTKAWWQSVSTGRCQRSLIFPSITTKCSGAGQCLANLWCRPRRRGERPPTG